MIPNFLFVLLLILGGLVLLFVLNATVNALVKKKIVDVEPPLTITILKLGIFLTGGILISQITESFQTLSKVLPKNTEVEANWITELSFYCMFLALVVLITFLLIWVSAMMYKFLSKGESIFAEAANGNLKAVLLYGGVIIALSMAVKSGLTPLFDQFIPYPTMPNYYG